MRFLSDQDVYAVTIRFLRDLGHDVLPVAQLGLARAEDIRLLEVSRRQGRIFITRDRHFGALVFLGGVRAGVIYLRIGPLTEEAVHAELARILGKYAEEELREAFVVIGPHRHRFRRLP